MYCSAFTRYTSLYYKLVSGKAENQNDADDEIVHHRNVG